MNLTWRGIRPVPEEPAKTEVSQFMKGDFPYIFRASDSTRHHPEDAAVIDPASVVGRLEGQIGGTPDNLERGGIRRRK